MMAAMTLLLIAWLSIASSQVSRPTTIDFIVTTGDGTPVIDLSAADVAVKIDGRTRTIRSLRVVKAEDAAASVTTSITSFVPEPYGTNALTEDGRSLVLAIDQDSFRPGREQPLREAIDGLLATLGPRDRVLFVTMPFGSVKVPFTTDHARIQRAVANTTGQRPQNETGSDMACRTRRVLEATAGFLDLLAFAEGPTSVVFFTGGMAAPRRDAVATLSPGMCELTVEQYTRVARAAGAARAHFYVAHPGDIELPTGTRTDSVASFTGSDNPLEGIEHLAGVTGGRRLPLSATGTATLARVTKETAAYYIAEVEPDASDRDGRSHQLNIRVSRGGTQVRFTPQIALNAGRPALRLRAAAFSTMGPGGKIKVMALIEPADPATLLSRATAVLLDDDGQVAAQWTAADPTQVPLTAAMVVGTGSYRLRVAAEDKSGAKGSAEFPLTAQLTPAGPLQVSSLVLGVSRDAVLMPKLEFGAEPVALGSVAFHGQATGRLTIGLEVARTPDGPAILSTPLAIERVGDEDYTATGAIPIGALPPGDYIVRAMIGVEGHPTARVVRTLRKVR